MIIGYALFMVGLALGLILGLIYTLLSWIVFMYMMTAEPEL
ncbi:hypothetical protein D1BOALGB6SA_10324 [Olavius sp. associated proteobacterium Delta 1]|nr:hypothetical protein D1BOALGB6SA_10324 [Olavius sp. associated proteobacterium Delta 1]